MLRYPARMKITNRCRNNLAVLAAALCAFASQSYAAAPPYAGFEIGQSSIGLKGSDLGNDGFQSVGGDRRDTGYAITLGWRFSPSLAAEASFTELGESSYDVLVDDGGPVSDATVKVRSSGILLALVGTWPVTERLSLEGRGGAYLGKTETRVRAVMSGPFGNQALNQLVGSDTKVGLAAGVGAVASLNETWAIRLGYDFLDKAFGADAGRISLGVRYNWP